MLIKPVPTLEEKIDTENRLMLDVLFPISIDKIENNLYKILFFAAQDSTESAYYLDFYIKTEDDVESAFIESFPIFSKTIHNNPAMQQRYIEFVKNMDDSNHYTTDFYMSKNNKVKSYFVSRAYRNNMKIGNKYCKVELLVSQDCFVQINVFLSRLFDLNNRAGNAFNAKKLKNTKFVTINHCKYNSSTTHYSSNVVISHFTCGRGPAIFKFNLINPKIPHKILKDPFDASSYEDLYGNDFYINDFFYLEDTLYAVYEERSMITDNYIATHILLFDEEMLKNTTFIDTSIIYKKEDLFNA